MFTVWFCLNLKQTIFSMPYFSHTMAWSIKKSMAEEFKVASNPRTASTRKTRSLPGNTKGSTDIYRVMDSNLVKEYRVKMTQRKMLFMQSLLHAQVGQMMECASTYPVDGYRSLFRAYKIDKTVVRHACAQVKVYSVKNVNRPEMSMAVRVYSRSELDPGSSVYLKILRHLAYKHPYIIHTMEMFSDQKNVYIFQEWATGGNLLEFMERNEPLTEQKAVYWTKQIHRALDFLGDLAIAHRDLSPMHLVVQPQQGNEVWLKLTGFSKSIIYWDVNNNDIQFCQCLPLERQKEDGPNFQPPEVYGSPKSEQFDPIQADIWSLGANIYYMLAKQYPFNVVDPWENIDEEIKHNIEMQSTLSEDCQRFLFALMRANANDRMPFDFIEAHPWLRARRVARQAGNKVQKSSANGKQGTSQTSKISMASESQVKTSDSISCQLVTGSAKSNVDVGEKAAPSASACEATTGKL